MKKLLENCLITLVHLKKELDDRLKALIINNYINNTNASRDSNYNDRQQYPYK